MEICGRERRVIGFKQLTSFEGNLDQKTNKNFDFTLEVDHI